MADHGTDPFGPTNEEEGVPELEGQPASKVATGDSQEGLVPPGERPLMDSGYSVTAAEERQQDTVAERVWREEPDVMTGDLDDGSVGRIIEGGGFEDVEDSFVDDEKQNLGLDSGDFEALSAEESAMHITEDPPM
jgi:hypothetical protein